MLYVILVVDVASPGFCYSYAGSMGAARGVVDVGNYWRTDVCTYLVTLKTRSWAEQLKPPKTFVYPAKRLMTCSAHSASSYQLHEVSLWAGGGWVLLYRWVAAATTLPGLWWRRRL